MSPSKSNKKIKLNRSDVKSKSKLIAIKKRASKIEHREQRWEMANPRVIENHSFDQFKRSRFAVMREILMSNKRKFNKYFLFIRDIDNLFSLLCRYFMKLLTIYSSLISPSVNCTYEDLSTMIYDGTSIWIY